MSHALHYEKHMFAEAVESLFVKMLGPQLSRECRQRLRAVGLDVARPLRAAYTLEQWKACLRLVASEVFPMASPSESYLELGRLYLRGWWQRRWGLNRGALAMRLGPRYALEQVVEEARAGNNFNEMRLQALGEDTATVWTRNVAADNPFFTCGLLHEALCSAGSEPLLVAPVAFDGTEATFRLGWRQALLHAPSSTGR